MRNNQNTEDRVWNIGCAAIILAVLLFVLIVLIVNGFSLKNALNAIIIAEASFFGIIGTLLALLIIPAIIIFFYSAGNSLRIYENVQKKWVKPLVRIILLLLLYLIYCFFTDTIIMDNINRWWYLGDVLSRVASILIYAVFVLFAHLYIQRHPDIKMEDFGIFDMPD